MDFLQKTPFFRLILPLIAGIITCCYLSLRIELQWGLIGLSLLLMLMSFAVRVPAAQYRFRWLFGSGIFLFLFVAGYFLAASNARSVQFNRLHQKGIYRVELTASPVEKAKSYKCRVKILGFYNRKWEAAHGEAMVYLFKDKRSSALLFGDRLLLDAEFSEPEKPLNPGGFDYAAYLKRQGVGATAYVPADGWKRCGSNEVFSLRREASVWRSHLLGIFTRFGIKGDEFAVLAALTLGYTDDLQPDLMAGYSATGAMHILSVSGMHVGIVYAVIAFLFGFLNKSRRTQILKAVLIISFLWVYAFLSGLSPAVVRAALMFSFVSVSACIGRKSQLYNTIFASAFFMLVINPNYLFDVGFQLSYAAVLSIVFFQPIINKWHTPKNKPLKLLWNLFAVSLAAQLGTVPITLYYFQQFPNYFLLTNFLAIPLSGLIIYVAIALLLFAAVPSLAEVIASVLKWLVWGLNYLISYIQHLPFSVYVVSMDIKQTVFIFLAIACWSAYYYHRRYVALVVGCIFALLSVTMSLYVNYQTLRSEEMIVYAGQKGTHISLVRHGKNTVITTDSTEILRIGQSYWRSRKFHNPEFKDMPVFFTFEGKRAMILTDDFLKRKISLQPLRVDYLIVGNRLKPNVKDVFGCVHPRMVIVDRNVSEWYTESIRRACEKNGVLFYSVASSGAFVLNLTKKG